MYVDIWRNILMSMIKIGSNAHLLSVLVHKQQSDHNFVMFASTNSTCCTNSFSNLIYQFVGVVPLLSFFHSPISVRGSLVELTFPAFLTRSNTHSHRTRVCVCVYLANEQHISPTGINSRRTAKNSLLIVP